MDYTIKFSTTREVGVQQCVIGFPAGYNYHWEAEDMRVPSGTITAKFLPMFICLAWMGKVEYLLTEALTYLHYTGHMIHRNICPASIFVTKKGTWKLGGLEYIG
uniref:Protein kinase domain-containing protein n=1 Tax=Megaselia scalaris TaxID=36166 RepID=T1GVG4_MEGSC